MSKSPNRLLASLPSGVYSALTPHLKIVADCARYRQHKYGRSNAANGAFAATLLIEFRSLILTVEFAVPARREFGRNRLRLPFDSANKPPLRGRF